MTRNGIEYNFDITPYIIEKGRFTLYFSSQNNVKRFIEKYSLIEKNINSVLKNRYKCNIICDDLSILNTYITIEKRNFKIKDNKSDVIYKSLSEITLKIKVV